MQEKSIAVAKQRRHLLKALLWLFVLSFLIITSGIPAESPRLPVKWKESAAIDSIVPAGSSRSLKQGIDHYQAKRYSLVLSVLPERQAAREALLGDYILFYRARANYTLKQYTEAIADYQLLVSHFPDSPLIREALIGQCQTLLEANNPKELLALLGNPKLGSGADTLYYEARALDLSGYKDKATDLYLRVYASYPKSKSAPLAEHYLISKTPGALTGARNYEARLQRAEALVREGDYSGARTLLVALARTAGPNSRSTEKRDLLLGEVEYRQGKTAAAMTHLRKVTAAHPELHARAIYLEGACSRRLEKEQIFIDLRDRGLKLYPKSADIEELCYSAATYYDVKCDAVNGKEAYRILLQSFPKGKYAERALWKLALFDYFERKYSDSAKRFWEFLKTYPEPLSAGPAIYWMGRCYEKLGDSMSAKYLFERAADLSNHNFYGQLAREAGQSLTKAERRQSIPGSDFEKVVNTCDGIRFEKIRFSEPDAAASRTIHRFQQLMSAGLSDSALSELRWGARRHPQDQNIFHYLIATLRLREKDFNGAISNLRRAVPDYTGRPADSLPDEFWESFFPVRHLRTITKQAAAANIGPALILGLIRQESAFAANARSRADARGLMQILPSTGRSLARKAGIRRFTPQKLFDPDTNIVLGTRHLASLLRTYGKPELALAAYNAGSTRVKLWMEKFGDLDTAEFVEQIPFAETRGYVKQVLSNKVHYDLLISESK